MDSQKFREMAEELESLPCPEGTDVTEWRQYCGRMARVASKEAEYLDMITASSATMWEGPAQERVFRAITDPFEVAMMAEDCKLTVRVGTALEEYLESRRGRVWAVAREWVAGDVETSLSILADIEAQGGFMVSEPR